MQDKLNANATSGNVNSTSAETLKRIFEAVVGKEYLLESSATSAMPHTAFEDDAVLVLHGRDLSAGGVCILDRVGGYGENPSSAERRRGNDDADANSGVGSGGTSGGGAQEGPPP